MSILSLFWPQTIIGWILWLCFIANFIPFSRHLLKTALGTASLFVVGISFVVGAFALPSKALHAFFAVPALIRGIFSGFFSYVVFVTMGNLEELYSIQLWCDFLFLRNGAPFTNTHMVGILGGLIAFGAFGTSMEGDPVDTEVPIGPRRLISFEEAKERLGRAFKK